MVVILFNSNTEDEALNVWCVLERYWFVRIGWKHLGLKNDGWIVNIIVWDILKILVVYQVTYGKAIAFPIEAIIITNLTKSTKSHIIASSINSQQSVITINNHEF